MAVAVAVADGGGDDRRFSFLMGFGAWCIIR